MFNRSRSNVSSRLKTITSDNSFKFCDLGSKNLFIWQPRSRVYLETLTS